MSLVLQYAADRRARLARLGAAPVKRPKPVEAKIIPIKPEPTIHIPPVEDFYPSFWCWDLASPAKRAQQHISVQNIQRAVCKEFDIPFIEMSSQRRTMDVTFPRQVAMYLCTEMTLFSYRFLGRYFGDKDHSTVVHAHRKIELLIKTNKELARKIAAIKARFR